jgi:succinate dehydrogenase hydrophobic anchor subunit
MKNLLIKMIINPDYVMRLAGLPGTLPCHKSYGHWINQRLSAVLALLAFSLFFLGDLPTGVCSILGLSLIIRHIIDGIENVILDYVHDSKLILLSSVFLKCVGALSLKYTYIFFVFAFIF